ncbi:MAG TPA: LysR family transcriptional regulator [Burkholderiaceae bacterium]|nr:LysR family transcriptional regulator [Burkholderiaceae bacterium]
MQDIDTKTLRIFVAVCDMQNMARAAEHEHIEPSAVSKRIAQMEATLGTPLLLRSRRGVRPTAAGIAVLEHARGVLFTMDRIAHDAATFASGGVGHVRLIATASAVAEQLFDDIASFMRAPENQNIQVEVEERLSRDLVRQIRSGMASLGVCWNNLDFEGLQQQPYREDHLAAAVHPGHPLARNASLVFEQTLDYEHVGLPPSTAVHTMLQQLAARKDRRLSYRVIVSNFDAAFRVVAANLAISIVPSEVGESYKNTLGIKIIPLRDVWATRRFAVCYQTIGTLQPAARRMVQHLVGCATRECHAEG